MERLIIILFICLFNAVFSFAQTIYEVKGTVKDSINFTNLEFANIYIEDSKNNIKEFAFTNEKGEYSISFISHDSLENHSLVAVYLGYKTKQIPLQQIHNQEINFFLCKQSVGLEEIIVEAESLPIIKKSDTTEYKVSEFIDSTENSVEDVLKKLPGFEVDEAGKITVNGKAIKNVLIEGDELFEQNYSIITKNVNGVILDKVETIDKHVDNPVLSGVQKSDDLIINLKLKQEYKNIISDSHRFAIGGGENLTKHFINSNIFSFGKKRKFIFIANSNNITEETLGDIGFITDSYQDNNLVSEIYEKEGVLSLSEINSLYIPKEYFDNSNRNLASLSWIENWTSNAKTKFTGIYYQRNIKQQFFDAYNYVDNDSSNYTLNNDSSSKIRQVQIQLKTDIINEKKTNSVQIYSSFKFNPWKQVNSAIQNNIFFSDTLLNNLENSPFHLFTGVQFTRKINENSAIQISSSANINKGEEYFRTNYSYSQLENYENLIQRTNMGNYLLSNHLQLLFNGNGYSTISQIGMEIEDERFYNNRNIINQDGSTLDNYDHTYRLKTYRPFLKIYVNKSIGAWLFHAGLRNKWQTLVKNTFERNTNFNLIEGVARGKYFISRDNHLQLSYNYNNSLPEWRDLLGDSIYLDHRSISISNRQINKGVNHSLRISYTYRNLSKFIFFNSSLAISYLPKKWGNYTNIQPEFNFTGQIFPLYSNNYYWNIALDKFFPSINSRFKVYYNFSIAKKNLILNEQYFTSGNTRNIISAEYGSSFDGWFNFFININYQKSIFKLAEINNTNFQQQSQQKLKLIMKIPKQKMTISTSFINSHFSNTLSSNIFFNIDTEISYSIKEQHLKLSFSNMLNKTKWVELQNNTLYLGESSYYLVPFFLLLEWKTSFSQLKSRKNR